MNSYLRILFFISLLHITVPTLEDPTTFTLQIPAEKTLNLVPFSVVITEGELIHNQFKRHCNVELGQIECNQIEDLMSRHVYNKATYTPTSANSTIEDHLSTRYDVVSYLRQRFNYKKFLEIGCNVKPTYLELRHTFELSHCVDPNTGGTHKLTSDEYFSTNSEKFDIIFVDGLHEAHQVLKDIHNSLRILNKNGTIVMHDCNPRDMIHQLVPQSTDWDQHLTGTVWTGDVWKAAVNLRLQDGLEIVIVDIDHGVGVIRRRKNEHRLPPQWESRLLVHPLELEWDELYNNREILLRLMSFQDMRNWLDEEEEVVESCNLLES